MKTIPEANKILPLLEKAATQLLISHVKKIELEEEIDGIITNVTGEWFRDSVKIEIKFKN